MLVLLKVSSTKIPLDSDVWKMDSPSFDLGSLSSSPFLYREGEDFLGQTVNTFFDEDISFDFVDTFEAGFSMAGRTDEVSATSACEKDQYLMRESPLLLTSPRGHDSSSEKELNITDSAETVLVSRREHVKLSQRENIAALKTSISETKNTCTNQIEPSSETVLSRKESKNAEERTQNAITQEATETDNALSTSHDNKDCVETGSQGEKIANTATPAASREDFGNNFQQNSYIHRSVHEKTTFANFTLLSLDEHTACVKERAYAIKGREISLRTADLEKEENNPSFGLKNSAFKRCVVPKTFYSPFWTPEKSTARQEKSLEDGFSKARRNVDILYCCNCKSQKRGAKNIQITMKPSQPSLTTSHKDSSRYIDFLKRNSVAVRSQGKHRGAYNKTISGGISRHGYICNEANRNDKWISLPAIDTSFRTVRQKASSNRDIGALYSRTVSIAPIDGLINKYKGRHFDLVEQQKRYQLKPFK